MSATAEEQCSLFVLLKNGNKAEFILPVQKPVVSFTHGAMQVDYQMGDGQQSLSFPRDIVEKLIVGETETDAIDDVQGDDSPRVKFDMTRAGVVHVSGLQATDHLQVFSLDGKSVSVAVSRHDNEATVDLIQKPRGIYMVSVNNRFTFKLMKP